MIVFYNEVQKAQVPSGILRLQRYLKSKEPELAQILYRFWGNQQNAITYAELRNALLMGAIDESTVEAWFQDYSKLVLEQMVPRWEDAINDAAKEVADRHSGFVFDAYRTETLKWTQTHAAELITQLVGDQRAAINAVIERAIALPGMPVDELARAIRPLVGLTRPQAIANRRYYENILSRYMEEHPRVKVEVVAKRAEEAAIKYAAKQHRLRAQTIAITELTKAHNMGELLSVKQAYNAGYMGRSKKRWIDSGDGRVCEECKRLNGTEVDLEASFQTKFGPVDVPPCHPRCGCSFLIIEQEPAVPFKT